MNERNNPWVGVAVGTITGVLVGLGGDSGPSPIHQSPGMGITLLFLVPMSAGFAIAMVTRDWSTGSAAMLLAALLSLAILIGTGREGLLCAVLALPLLAIGIGLGAFLGWIVRRKLDAGAHRGGTMVLFLVLGPAAILTGQRVEKPLIDETRREVVTDSVWVPVAPEAVWPGLQSIDKLDGSRPFLMYIGLPIPLSCRMNTTGVGAKRTCYFEHGYIEETVIKWQPPYSMVLSIDRTNMPGPHWLGFEMADYELRAENGGTTVTRTTTITSHLYPVWYWRYFERLGVASEHRYLLSDLQNRWKK